ncbi:MAG: TIR domain-containing protein [Proteobacteria bacterium]|nr:TIR domain-containing protein [Pseudomonadota bacterium]
MDTLFLAYNDECDSARANHVRKQLLSSGRYQVDGYSPFTTWSKTHSGPSVEQIENAIQDGLARSIATLVLIGSDSAANRWIRYAIEQSYTAKKPMLGLYINDLADERGKNCIADVNPLERFAVLEQGKKIYLSERYDSYAWSDLGDGKFETWLELARQKAALAHPQARKISVMPRCIAVSESVPELETMDM